MWIIIYGRLVDLITTTVIYMLLFTKLFETINETRRVDIVQLMLLKMFEISILFLNGILLLVILLFLSTTLLLYICMLTLFYESSDNKRKLAKFLCTTMWFLVKSLWSADKNIRIIFVKWVTLFHSWPNVSNVIRYIIVILNWHSASCPWPMPWSSFFAQACFAMYPVQSLP